MSTPNRGSAVRSSCPAWSLSHSSATEDAGLAGAAAGDASDGGASGTCALASCEAAQRRCAWTLRLNFVNRARWLNGVVEFGFAFFFFAFVFCAPLLAAVVAGCRVGAGGAAALRGGGGRVRCGAEAAGTEVACCSAAAPPFGRRRRGCGMSLPLTKGVGRLGRWKVVQRGGSQKCTHAAVHEKKRLADGKEERERRCVSLQPGLASFKHPRRLHLTCKKQWSGCSCGHFTSPASFTALDGVASLA